MTERLTAKMWELLACVEECIRIESTDWADAETRHYNRGRKAAFREVAASLDLALKPTLPVIPLAEVVNVPLVGSVLDALQPGAVLSWQAQEAD